MSQVLYLQIDRNVEVSKREVTIGDVATIFCADKSITAKVKAIKLITIPKSKSNKKRICISAMRVIELIAENVEEVEVSNIGETDFIVDYIYEQSKINRFLNNKNVQRLLIGFVALFTFMGSVYAIMAYNNDVDTTGIFENVYNIFGNEQLAELKILEIAYAVGLAGGIIVFYNHFGGKRFGTDPTPIEVEMDKYESDVDMALIDRSTAAKKEKSVQ